MIKTLKCEMKEQKDYDFEFLKSLRKKFRRPLKNDIHGKYFNLNSIF